MNEMRKLMEAVEFAGLQATAKFIRDQLGIKAFRELGAWNLVIPKGGGLSFRIRSGNQFNYVRITPSGNDVYNIEFGRMRGMMDTFHDRYNIAKIAKNVSTSRLRSTIINRARG